MKEIVKEKDTEEKMATGVSYTKLMNEFTVITANNSWECFWEHKCMIIPKACSFLNHTAENFMMSVCDAANELGMLFRRTQYVCSLQLYKQCFQD